MSRHRETRRSVAKLIPTRGGEIRLHCERCKEDVCIPLPGLPYGQGEIGGGCPGCGTVYSIVLRVRRLSE